MSYCKTCGEPDCKKHSFFIGKPIELKEFSGSSPPEIFVGKWNYPNVYTGILSPEEHGNTEIMSSPELWHEKKLSIPEILSFRNKLIYGRKQNNIKNFQEKFLSIMQEIAMTHKSVSTEFRLKKSIRKQDEQAPNSPLISNSAEVESVLLQENAPVKTKVDYLVNDVDAKSVDSILELSNSGIPNSNITKLLSAGLLGKKQNRKLVPTRWSITAVDDTISKEKLKKIRIFQELGEIQVFSAYFLGNNYAFLLLPDKWSFEVIEYSMKSKGFWQDSESFFSRKNYASDVTGAYYANRLALTEYLEKIKRQCQCIVFREVRPEYTSPLGVGILRQTSREAFSKKPVSFTNVKLALNYIQSLFITNINKFTERSQVLKDYGKQKRLTQFF